MGDRLPKTQIKEASKQRRRIKDAKDRAFEKAMNESKDTLEKKSESEPETRLEECLENVVEEVSKNTKRACDWNDDEASSKRRMSADASTFATCQTNSRNETCISGRHLHRVPCFIRLMTRSES